MPLNTASARCVAGLLGWATAIGLGFFVLGEYHHRPGRPGEPPAAWPAGGPLAPDPARPTLLMFLHPRCPCSRASVAELASILGRRVDRVAATAVLFRPEASPSGWARAAAGLDAASIAGLRLLDDPGGATARRFGVETSGHVLLYDPDGRLRFSGGITPSRGHRGDNLGLAAVLARLDGAAGGADRSPIFGCPTNNPPTSATSEAVR